MAENRFLTYKDKPIVKCGKEIYYGDMSEPYVVRFNILSTKKEGDDTIPEKVSVELLKSDTQLPEKERVSKNTVKDSFFDALDVGFIWLERALKSSAR